MKKRAKGSLGATRPLFPDRADAVVYDVKWIKQALKDFERFPEGAQAIILAALTIAAEGGKADIAKPMHGMGWGVFEIAPPSRGDAYRLVYAVQLAGDIWVVHAFQQKSTQGIETPKPDL